MNVTGLRFPAVIVLPEMVTGRPSALKFSVLGPPLWLPPSTEIGVVAEGAMLNVSLPVAPRVHADRGRRGDERAGDRHGRAIRNRRCRWR